MNGSESTLIWRNRSVDLDLQYLGYRFVVRKLKLSSKYTVDTDSHARIRITVYNNFLVSFRVTKHKLQYCGSGKIYSGSSFEFSESRVQVRIRIQPILFKPHWKKTHTLNSIKIKNLPTICHVLFHTTVLQCTHSPEFTGLKFKIVFIYASAFIFCWTIPNSGSRQKFNPDPQHCIKENHLKEKVINYHLFQKI